MDTSNSHGIVNVPPSLSYFCVYNPSLGGIDDSQGDQILYYTSKRTVPMDVKIRQVGLAQGLVNFTRVFSPTKPCENVHTQKNRLAFYEPEPDYWIHISIELGYVKKVTKDKEGKPKTTIDYLDSNLHDSGVKRMLELGYEMYRIFNGPFEYTVRTAGIKTLKNKLEEFFANWVFEWDFEKTELTKTVDGILYMPLSDSAESQIMSFINQVQSDYEFISDMFVIWQNKLVYRGNGAIPVNNVRGIWRHLVSYIAERDEHDREIENSRKSKEAEKASTFMSFTRNISGSNLFSYFSSSTTPKVSPSTSPTNSTSYNPSFQPLEPNGSSSLLSPSTQIFIPGPSNFLLGPTNLHGPDEDIQPVKVYLSKNSSGSSIRTVNHQHDVKHDVDESDIEEYYLVAYKQNALTLVFFIPLNPLEGSAKIQEMVFYRSFHNYLSSQSEEIIKILNENHEKTKKLGRTDIDKEYRYLFFNKMTLAVKSSLYPFSSNGSLISSSKGLTITSEMAHALCELHEDLERYPQLTEIYTRSSTNFWIVGKRSEGRVLYIVVPKKEASLAEVEDDVRRITAIYFSGNNIF
ncbi:vacuolar fusion protein CCZ1 homolog [Rhizophagus clarus]|uniref:Vacuolar fusion protein CCZ1 homolog n=1 Tax=Rhizophagus clarus TaxID=94130 RepID=A0A8H3QEA5_9GLOM|nr:vacuolar fusion protein CCZ1 homolog [Rhizophagus clarus]